MTELYNHPDARQLAAVIEAQSVIAGTVPPDEGKPSGNKLQAGQETNGLKITKNIYIKSGYHPQGLRVKKAIELQN